MRARPIERDILSAAGYGLLLTVGVAATFLLYWSLLTSVQILASGSGSVTDDTAGYALWATGLVIVLGAVPMLRFLLTELPNRVAALVRIPRVQAEWLGLFVLGAVLLFLV